MSVERTAIVVNHPIYFLSGKYKPVINAYPTKNPIESVQRVKLMTLLID